MGEMGAVESAWREKFCLGIKYPDFPPGNHLVCVVGWLYRNGLFGQVGLRWRAGTGG
jgi:hypothetical protein